MYPVPNRAPRGLFPAMTNPAALALIRNPSAPSVTEGSPSAAEPSSRDVPMVIDCRPDVGVSMIGNLIWVRFAISSISICAAFFSGVGASGRTTIAAFRRSTAAEATEQSAASARRNPKARMSKSIYAGARLAANRAEAASFALR
jgi:hypothetical protein